MIADALTGRQNPATTSDQWHVVHSEWKGRASNHPPFARSIVSEHKNKAAADVAGKQLAMKLQTAQKKRPLEERDQIFVRPPGFRSLKFTAQRMAARG
jgi:hypothetical protein